MSETKKDLKKQIRALVMLLQECDYVETECEKGCKARWTDNEELCTCTKIFARKAAEQASQWIDERVSERVNALYRQSHQMREESQQAAFDAMQGVERRAGAIWMRSRIASAIMENEKLTSEDQHALAVMINRLPIPD